MVSIVNEEIVAYDSFSENYKSPGSNGIFAALLKQYFLTAPARSVMCI